MENQERSRNLIRLVGCWSIVAIVFWLCHLYCFSKHKMSTILIANVANLARFVTLTFWFKKLFKFSCVYYLYNYMIHDWTTILGYIRRELSNNKHVVLSKTKFVILHHYLPITATSPHRPLSSVPKVAEEERFDYTIIFLYLVLTKAVVEGSLLVLSLGPWLQSTATHLSKSSITSSDCVLFDLAHYQESQVLEKLKTRLSSPGNEAALRQLVKTFKVYEHAHKDLNKPPFT